MRLTGLGKFILLILAVGVAIGGWRMWQDGKGGGFKIPSVNLPKRGGGGTDNGGGKTGGNGGGSSDGIVEIPFVITAAKKDWVGDQVERFNAANKDKWRITTQAVPSREAMHSILSGNNKPVLWSPGSPIWPARLSEAWQEKNNNTILDLNDPNAYRVFLRSPLVILTTRQKAKFLRPLLGGPQPWVALRELSTGRRRVPWRGFRFSHADPLTSSSGMLTLGLILFDYGQRTGQAGSMERVATSSAFMSYLKELEDGLIYDAPAQKGTTALTNAFIADTSRYDFITAYESAALEAAPKKSDIAVIYPSPTAVSEHAVSLLSGEWVTQQQREGALAFMQFLGTKQALQDGLKYHFRPAQAGGSLSLAPELSRYAAQGFQQSFAPIELPPYQALNAAAYKWRVEVAGKPAG